MAPAPGYTPKRSITWWKANSVQDNGVLFNSFQFLIFFVLVWALVLSTRGTVRRVIILIASYYFYMCWSTRYIWVIWGITLLDYVAGLEIERSETQGRRRFYLGLSI